MGELIADLFELLFETAPRAAVTLLFIAILAVVAYLVIQHRNQDLRFDVQELHISCTGSKNSTELECQPQTSSSSNGTPCITWPKAYQANFGPQPVQVCTHKGVVEKLAIVEQDERYEIKASGRIGYLYKADFYASE